MHSHECRINSPNLACKSSFQGVLPSQVSWLWATRRRILSAGLRSSPTQNLCGDSPTNLSMHHLESFNPATICIHEFRWWGLNVIKGWKTLSCAQEWQLIPQLLYIYTTCNIQGGLKTPASGRIAPLESSYWGILGKEEIALLSHTYECKRSKKRPPARKLVNIRSANGLNKGLHLHNWAENRVQPCYFIVWKLTGVWYECLNTQANFPQIIYSEMKSEKDSALIIWFVLL